MAKSKNIAQPEEYIKCIFMHVVILFYYDENRWKYVFSRKYAFNIFLGLDNIFWLGHITLLDSHCHGWYNQSGFIGDNAFGISINYDKTIVNIASAWMNTHVY